MVEYRSDSEIRWMRWLKADGVIAILGGWEKHCDVCEWYCTDKNGNTYFESFQHNLSGKDYEQAGDRTITLRTSMIRILSLTVHLMSLLAMDNPERVLTDGERTEHEELTKI